MIRVFGRRLSDRVRKRPFTAVHLSVIGREGAAITLPRIKPLDFDAELPGPFPLMSMKAEASNKEIKPMCDYSLQTVMSRPAKVGDVLTTRNFGTGTCGFAAAEDANVAVCLLPGTELAFSEPVRVIGLGVRFFFAVWRTKTLDYTTAIFRQVNKHDPRVHHDVVEFPDGQSVLLTHLCEDQTATVLQLPAAPGTPAEQEVQTRAAYV